MNFQFLGSGVVPAFHVASIHLIQSPTNVQTARTSLDVTREECNFPWPIPNDTLEIRTNQNQKNLRNLVLLYPRDTVMTKLKMLKTLYDFSIYRAILSYQLHSACF